MRAQDRNSLLRALCDEYDAHGCQLVPHLVTTYARLLGIAPSSVAGRLNRYLSILEASWSLADHPVSARDLARLVKAEDALAAYAIARRAGMAPPTLRQFLRVFLRSGAFPELAALVMREKAAQEDLVMGIGRRGCGLCASRSGRGTLKVIQK